MSDFADLRNTFATGVVGWIYDQLDEENRERFVVELNATFVDPDTIARDASDSPTARPAVIEMGNDFMRVLRAWHVSVVLATDPRWIAAVTAPDSGEFFDDEGLAALRSGDGAARA